MRQRTPLNPGGGGSLWSSVLAALVGLVALWASPASLATDVKDLVRIKGQGESILRGLGLVVGLPGTGDSGKELVMARPLAQVLANEGNAIGDLRELGSTKSVALVLLTCVIPEAGARIDDRFDITVSTVNSAQSLKGGTLYLAPLSGPYPGSPVFAMAAGPVEIEGETPTTGRVRGGARMVRDILMPEVGDTFDLIVDPHFSGWASVTEIAGSIDRSYFNSPTAAGPSIARAVDDRTVRVTVPLNERADRAAFISDVLSTDINVAMMKLPAQVIVNGRTGSIIVTGDVEISPVVLTHKDLVITTTVPPPQPTPDNPLVQRDSWTSLSTAARPTEKSKLADLLEAFKQLQVPASEQISILQQLHKIGKLQAKLVVD